MADTTNFALPLVAAAQAQKHVTVNEALTRLDGLAQLRILSRAITLPPAAVDGETYFVPTGAQNAWAGHEGELAIFSNGGWVYSVPSKGWRGWIEDESTPVFFDGADWVAGGVAASPSGAASKFEAIEIAHTPTAGSSSTTTSLIPANSVVFGVTGRVTSDLTGSLASWELGVSGSTNRYGSGLGAVAGSFAHGLTSGPLAYYSATPLELTATGGTFDGGGSVTLVAHLYRMSEPV